MRWSFDLATGYKHDNAVALGKKDPSAAAKKYAMSEEKWMTRFIFLESIAGVPGMVGGMVRHLESLRVLRKDNGEFLNQGRRWAVLMYFGRLDLHAS